EGRLLTALATYPCMVFLGAYAATADHKGGLLAITQKAFDGMTGQVVHMLTESGEKMTPDMTRQLHDYFMEVARVMPAMSMCMWLFTTVAVMAVAQAFLARRGWNMRPSFSLARLHLPSWIIFAAAIAGLTANFAPAPYDYIGLNIAILMVVPFFFVGLAVVHAAAAQTRASALALTVFYLALILVIHLVLLVALLGAVDQWADFRKRFAERNDSNK
ncbi:MAG: DUF2232 domain-containing protein, partial [Alphaproteobacteria bacterium]|nr:DUF2232 domain-containing protein [Alphaproteobacteria bacterium]